MADPLVKRLHDLATTLDDFSDWDDMRWGDRVDQAPPLLRETADRIEALESEWDRLADSLRHAGVEPWHDGRSLLDGKRPREQHIAMIVAAERAAREAAEAKCAALHEALCRMHFLVAEVAMDTEGPDMDLAVVEVGHILAATEPAATALVQRIRREATMLALTTACDVLEYELHQPRDAELLRSRLLPPDPGALAGTDPQETEK